MKPTAPIIVTAVALVFAAASCNAAPVKENTDSLSCHLPGVCNPPILPPRHKRQVETGVIDGFMGTLETGVIDGFMEALNNPEYNQHGILRLIWLAAQENGIDTSNATPLQRRALFLTFVNVAREEAQKKGFNGLGPDHEVPHIHPKSFLEKLLEGFMKYTFWPFQALARWIGL